MMMNDDPVAIANRRRIALNEAVETELPEPQIVKSRNLAMTGENINLLVDELESLLWDEFGQTHKTTKAVGRLRKIIQQFKPNLKPAKKLVLPFKRKK